MQQVDKIYESKWVGLIFRLAEQLRLLIPALIEQFNCNCIVIILE